MRKVLGGLKTAIEAHFEQEEKACFEVLKTELSPEEAEESRCEHHREFVPLIAAIDRATGELGQGSALLIRAEAGGIHETLSHEGLLSDRTCLQLRAL